MFSSLRPARLSLAALTAALLLLLVLLPPRRVHALDHGARDRDWDWVDELPECWRECLDDAGDEGCEHGDCICDAAQSTAYLPPAISCIARTCAADYWAIQGKFLIPLTAYCLVTGNPVPIGVVREAESAADGEGIVVTTTGGGGPEPTHSHDDDEHDEHDEHDDSDGEEEVEDGKGKHRMTEVLSTTVTKTSTDDEGRTVWVVMPIVFGPQTTSFGDIETVTATGGENAEPETRTTVSDAQERSTARGEGDSGPEETGRASLTTTASAAEETGGEDDDNVGNGTPFEDMAGAGRWHVGRVLVGVGVGAAVIGVLGDW